jgi:hypothetical protein
VCPCRAGVGHAVLPISLLVKQDPSGAVGSMLLVRPAASKGHSAAPWTTTNLCFANPMQVLAAEVVALEEARVAARAAELRASAAARDAGDEARTAKLQAAKLAAERESLAAAVSSLQVRQIQ